MTEKRSVYIGSGLIRALGGRPTTEGLTRAVNAIAGRYADIVRAHRPDLSIAEWCLICDASNGLVLGESSAPSGSWIWAEVSDADLWSKWNVSPELVGRLRDLDLAATYAVADVVERFWASDLTQPAAAILESILNE